MKHSEILRKTKNILWDGDNYNLDKTFRSEFICNALDLLELRDCKSDDHDQKVKDIKQYINKTLNKGLTKEQKERVNALGIMGWLEVKGYNPSHGFQMQEYRQQWLDHMISEYEKVGK